MNAARFAASRIVAPATAATTATMGAVWLNTDPVMAKESKADLAKIRESVVDLIETDEGRRGDGTSLKGTFIRLAWHCCGTYQASDKTGGSNGAMMRFKPEAAYGNNAGLDKARAALEPIKAKYPEITYADLYTYVGVIAVEESGGPTIPYQTGRADYDEATAITKSDPKDRLPNATMGSFQATTNHVRKVLGRMGFNDREMVALSGAHAMGRCHTDRSGFWGPWTFAETTFSNEYFRLLVEERWTPKLTHNGKPWTGPDQFEDSTGKLMMLPSDIVLIKDPEFRKLVEMYAKDEDLFFKDFAKAFAKLLELGVPFATAMKPWYKFW